MPRALAKRLALAAAVGAAVGLALFAAETVLILRGNAIGLSMDVRGPAAELLAAAKPAILGLLARVLAIYMAAGAVGSVLAAGLACALAGGSGPLFVLLWWMDGAVGGGLLALATAVERPALFDDLPFGRAVLSWCVERGQPWQPKLAAVVFYGIQLAGVLFLFLGRHHLRRPSRRAWVFLPLALGFAAALWVIADLRRHIHPQPLVVVVGLDAFRPDRVEPGAPHAHVAPNLEKLLADATTFSHAYTPIAQTEPAWRSLLTARWPTRTGVRYPLTADERRLPAPTFAATFAQAGFQTTFATDCSRFNYLSDDSGFTQRLQPPRGALNFLLEKLRYRGIGMWADNALGAWWVPELVENRALAGLYDPVRYAHWLARVLARQAHHGPTLFAYHATAAHFPGDPVYPFYRRYVSPAEPLARRLRMFFAPVSPGAKGEWTRQGSEALYDELLAEADAQLGVLLDTLRAEGLYDNALVVVFSDHGESFHADHPALAGATPVHGARLSDEENRILLAVKLPKSMAGAAPRRVDGLVRLIDLGPTLLEEQALPPLPHADGESLLPALQGRPLAARYLYAETGYTHIEPDVFDPGHFSAGPRGLEAYEIQGDGRVVMTARADALALREKDVGARDLQGWLIRSPRTDGTVEERCLGVCSDALRHWLDSVREPKPFSVR